MRRALPLILMATCFTALLAADLSWQPLNEPGSGGWLTSLRINPSDSSHLVLGGDMLGIGVSRDQGRSWSGGFGLPSWEIGDLTFDPTDPRIIWAGTMSGPVVSRDGGTTWESKRQGFPPMAGGAYSAPIQRILLDPANRNRLLAFAGSYRGWESPGSPKFGYIWESLDGGESWQEFSAVRPYRNITWVDGDLNWNLLYAVVQSQGVFVSSDRGKTWTKATEGLPEEAAIRMVAVHPKNGNTAWVATGNYPAKKGSPELKPGGIYQTTDGGKSWHPSSQGLPTQGGTNRNFVPRFQAIAVSPVDPQKLATADTSWASEAVYHSSDGGETWVKVFDKARAKEMLVAYPAGMGASVLTFDPHEANTLYAANSETVLRTADSGTTWTDITSTPVSKVAPLTWRGHGYSGLCSTRVVFNPTRPGSVILTAMDAGKHLRSDDDLKSWFFVDKGFAQPWGGANDAAFAGSEGQIVYLAAGQHGGQGAIARSDDGGRNWREFHGKACGLPDKAEAVAVHCNSNEPDQVWAIMGGFLHASRDGGKSWKKFPEFPGATTIGKLPSGTFPFYVGYREGVLKTEDGENFSLLPGSPKSPSRIQVSPSSPDQPYVVRHRADDGGVFRWDGSSWEQIFKNKAAYDVALHPGNPLRMAVATSDDPFHDKSTATGVWITEDGGKTWRESNNGLSCLRGKTIAFDPHEPERLIFGSFGRGFFQATWPASDTAALP